MKLKLEGEKLSHSEILLNQTISILIEEVAYMPNLK